MSDKPVRILLVEDNIEYANRLTLEIERASPSCFEFFLAPDIQDALDAVNGGEFDLVLLALMLPDSQGLAAFNEIHKVVPQLPVIVLTSQDDLSFSRRLILEGVQDCLVKSQIDTDQLTRAIWFALERQRTTEVLRQLSVIDELTGLLNRR
ncbi:MAG: response regulator, partial [Anaerolineales bacterium]